MQTKVIFISFALFACSAMFSQTRNYEQELADLLSNRKMEEAISYYAQYQDSIHYPFIRQLYSIMTNTYLNQPDKVLAEMPSFVDQYYETALDKSVLSFLLDNCFRKTDFEKVVKIADAVKVQLEINPRFETTKEATIKLIDEIRNKYAGLPARNYGQELADLLSDMQIEDAMSYYTQYQDSIHDSFIRQFYSIMTNTYLNQPDKVLAEMPSFVAQYYETFPNNNLLHFLLDNCFQIIDFENAVKITDAVKDQLETNPKFETTKEPAIKTIDKIRNYYRNPIQVEFKQSAEFTEIPIQTEFWITFNAEYNNSQLKTIFDTGVPYAFFTSKKWADRIGIKITESYDINEGINAPTAFGVIDSVKIGNMFIKNAPVCILGQDFLQNCIPDSLLNDPKAVAKIDSISNLMEIIMGIPMMRILKHIQLDFQTNRMIVFPNQKKSDKTSNLFITSNIPYVKTKVNNIPFLAFFDTGAMGDALVINHSFYQKHTNEIVASKPVDNDAKFQGCGINGIISGTDLLQSTDLKLNIGDYMIDLTNENRILLSLPSNIPSTFIAKDGYIGFDLLKKLKKITFDFEAMRVDCE